MSRQIHRKCQRGYWHFFVRKDTTWDPPDEHGTVLREILLVCARCEYHLWIDSTVRPYPFPWIFALDPSDHDWGT